MIIKSKFRDIPLSEVPCVARVPWIYQKYEKEWNERRGKEIFIIVPAANQPVDSGCTEPRYEVVDAQGRRVTGIMGKLVSVCPHVAEIGD